ncbi:S8 family serine peptidase [Methylomonas sp. SURF-2]|uniref:S8 family serine peptidase n=1 Tax=Methylomonas subterranea TaxID=2952225 RepID=A0ABT1TC49_9GAMM|nr:S8 family serine peptidase [Methylomonas sp. SURF-2]MCQ8103028.1 S8 family serine peptidase [Methylomonas sp. SURF-2]
MLRGGPETIVIKSPKKNRWLVVAFVDKTINRSLAGNALDGYRVRGRYGNSGWSERAAEQLADRHRLQLIAQWPVTELCVSCVVYEVPVRYPLQQVMSRLREDDQVALVQRMQTFETRAESAIGPAGDPYLSLQSGFKALGISELHKAVTGRGIRVALLDSGVDLDHPDLQGQITHFENVAPEPADHDLADVHGTAVAGIISARCNSFTLAVALNRAMRMHSHIINLSLAGPEDPLVRQLITAALAKDIIIVAALPARGRADGFPANVSGVLAVGRGDETDRAEIIAPGLDILTTVPHEAYDFMTGSSFASPRVAGLAALLLQRNPNWRAADIKSLLAGDLNSVFARLLTLRPRMPRPPLGLSGRCRCIK